MAAVLKLLDVLPCDYKLIAVHSALDDYRLAYFLNKILQLQLAKENQKASSVSYTHLTLPTNSLV